jgi:ubiquinone/menaquinone biosynthesis C-methylase UbiE
MSASLPEMGAWDSVFDETYLQTYLHQTDSDRSRQEALAATELAGVEPGAEILDCPCGFGRHAIPLAEASYRITGCDRSESQLVEAERRRGTAEWPKLVRGDYRTLPFEDASFDAVLNLFSSLGYLERDEDVGVLREFRRVLRPGGALVLETAHRDGFARFAQPVARRTWDRLPDGSLYLEERTPDWSAGTVETYRLIVSPTGERVERPYVLHVYAAKEWLELLREAGFGDAQAFGAWDGVTPISPDVWRLILLARRSSRSLR